jgi:hypothetical protein
MCPPTLSIFSPFLLPLSSVPTCSILSIVRPRLPFSRPPPSQDLCLGTTTSPASPCAQGLSSPFCVLLRPLLPAAISTSQHTRLSSIVSACHTRSTHAVRHLNPPLTSYALPAPPFSHSCALKLGVHKAGNHHHAQQVHVRQRSLPRRTCGPADRVCHAASRTAARCPLPARHACIDTSYPSPQDDHVIYCLEYARQHARPTASAGRGRRLGAPVRARHGRLACAGIHVACVAAQEGAHLKAKPCRETRGRCRPPMHACA